MIYKRAQKADYPLGRDRSTAVERHVLGVLLETAVEVLAVPALRLLFVPRDREKIVLQELSDFPSEGFIIQVVPFVLKKREFLREREDLKPVFGLEPVQVGGVVLVGRVLKAPIRFGILGDRKFILVTSVISFS